MNPARAFRSVLTVALVFSAPMLAKKPAAAEPDGSTVVMPEVRTSPDFHCNFGFGIAVFGNTDVGTINHVFIDGVVEDSLADQMGLKTGDEILSINGRKVTELNGGTKVDGELFNLLVDRPAGERINIEVLIRTTKRLDLTAGIR